MRNLIIPTILILMIGISFSVNANMQMPNESGVNSTILSSIKLTGNADKADLALIVPSGWTLQSWDVYGIPKENINFTYENLNGKKVPHFMIKDLVSSASFSLYFKVNKSGTLTGIVTYKENNNSGFLVLNKSLQVRYSTCGNGICEPGENANNCPVDCGAQKTNYIALIGLSAVIIIGIGYWLWRKRNL